MRSSSWSFILRSEVSARCSVRGFSAASRFAGVWVVCACAAVANANATARAMPESFNVIDDSSSLCESWLRPSQQARDQRDQEKDHEHHEQNLGDLGRAGGYAGEAEHRRDDGDDEKRKRPAQHDELLKKVDAARQGEQTPCRDRPGFRRVSTRLPL